jgi:hypothetical protein
MSGFAGGVNAIPGVNPRETASSASLYAFTISSPFLNVGELTSWEILVRHLRRAGLKPRKARDYALTNTCHAVGRGCRALAYFRSSTDGAQDQDTRKVAR